MKKLALLSLLLVSLNTQAANLRDCVVVGEFLETAALFRDAGVQQKDLPEAFGSFNIYLQESYVISLGEIVYGKMPQFKPLEIKALYVKTCLKD